MALLGVLAAQVDAIGPIPHAPGDDLARLTAELELARAQVYDAESRANETRARLNAFLTMHFDHQRQLDHPPLPAAVPEESRLTFRVNPDAQRLQAQLSELRTKRDQLLETLTDAHPEVVDLDGKVAAIQARLAAAGIGAEGVDTADPSSDRSNQAWPQYLERLKTQNATDAAEYQRLFDAWQLAEHELKQARAAESQAIQKLARLPVHAPPIEPQRTHAPVEPPAVTQERLETVRKAEPLVAVAPPATAQSDVNTQGLTLAALAIALAISALAAVRLARLSADPLFGSADEVAAALAIPVVGIVPAGAQAIYRVAVPLRRGFTRAGHLVLALLVFLAVAYAIGSAHAVWRFCANPIASLRALLGL